MSFFKAFMAFLLTFLVIDAAWIALFALKIYQTEIGHLIAETPRLGVAVMFYAAYSAIAVHLVVVPSKSLKQASINGALLGFVAYGTYAVTNYAMIGGWTTKLAFIDLIWGAVVTATCAFASFMVVKTEYTPENS